MPITPTTPDTHTSLNEAFYRSLFDLANDGIILIRGEQYYDCNQRALEMLGRPREQVIGYYPWDLSPATQPDGQKSEVKGRNLLRHGYLGGRQNFEWVHGTADGTLITLEVSLSLIPDIDDPYLLCHLRDISDRLRTEEALRNSEKRYRRVVEDQTDFIVRWLPDGTHTFANESYCRYFGKSCEALIGSSFFSLIAPEELVLVKKRLHSLTPDKPINTGEHRAITPQGNCRWQRWIDRAFFDDDGQIIELQSVGRDIHDQKLLEEALRVSEEKYSKAFRKSPFATVLSRMRDGAIIEVNKAFEDMTGYLEEEATGISTADLGLWTDPLQRVDFIEQLKDKGSLQGYVNKSWIKSGELRDCIFNAEIIEINDEPCILTLAQDVTDANAAEAALEYQATHDCLTDMPNRDMLRKQIEQAISMENSETAGIVLLVMDLNRFKEINDTLGHHTGDQLLKNIGPRLMPLLEDVGGILARLGGDEFAILLTGLHCEQQIIDTVSKIQEALDSPFEIDGIALNVSASMGISCYPEQGQDASALLRCADVAMYLAKEEGCGYAFYQPEKDHYSTRRLALLSDLRTAIAEDQLLLHYQPKIDAQNRQLLGFEALVRWQHPEHGLIPPGQFVPLAELGESIHPMTKWVLKNAIRQCADWQRQGLDNIMSVNFSTRNLMNELCAEHLEWLLKLHGVDPSRLEIEITESAFISDPERALTNLDRIHATGVQLALDDFGTGYSSMAYLKRMPIQTLKVDMTFVQHMSKNPKDALMVKSAIYLAHNLGLKVVAEGVEDEQTLNLLRDMGCDIAQGYYIAKPMPAAQAVSWSQQLEPVVKSNA